MRFRTPDDGETVIVDLVRGKPTFDNALIEDFVIARGDGSPVFLLANVVDDMVMGITHVIRAEEHLPNAPKQQLLWEALGAEPPAWVHAPILVNEKRQKLSKRRDRVALEDFRAEGYLPEAMRNYLMLLGWAPSGDREIVPWDDIVAEFRLEDGVDFLFLDEFLFLEEPAVDEAAWAKAMNPSALALLAAAIEAYESCEWRAEVLKAALEAVGVERGLKLGKAQAPVRVAVTGRTVGLPLFESIEILGRERTLARLRAALDRLS